VRHLQAARQVAGEGGLQTDIVGDGVYLTYPPAPALMLAEIIDKTCAWKQEQRSSSGWPYNWHYTVARPVLYYYSDDTWAVPTPAMDADSSSSSSGILDEYVVHPTGYPQPLAENMRLHDAFWPLYSVGDWVWCVYDAESGLWAIHDGYESWLRVELAEDLHPGRSALAYLLESQQCPPGEFQDSSSSSGIYEDYCGQLAPASKAECDEEYLPNTSFTFRIYDALCGQQGIAGQRAYVKFFAESRRFEVVTIAPQVFYRFELAEDLSQWQSTPCKAYRRCYDKMANGGYFTDCNQMFKIGDWSDIGFFGYADEGTTGVCEMHRCESGESGYLPGWIGVITNMRCPSECICGEEGPEPSCEEASSSSGS
jgi:hypothetical protein